MVLTQPDWCHDEKREFGHEETPGTSMHRAKSLGGLRPRSEASRDTKPLSRTFSVQTVRTYISVV